MWLFYLRWRFTYSPCGEEEVKQTDDSDVKCVLSRASLVSVETLDCLSGRSRKSGVIVSFLAHIVQTCPVVLSPHQLAAAVSVGGLRTFMSLWSLLQRVWCVPAWPSCPPPQRSCSRAVPHWCVWPAGAPPHCGAWAGRWGAAAPAQGPPTAWRSRGVTAASAGAAPWSCLQTSGRRWPQWAVRPVWVDRALSLRPWSLTSAQSRSSCLDPCCFSPQHLGGAPHLFCSHVPAWAWLCFHLQLSRAHLIFCPLVWF